MDQKKRKNSALRRAGKTIRKISGRAESPRLTVFRSNRHLYLQAIDDLNGVTLEAVSDFNLKPLDLKKKPLDQAAILGRMMAKKLADRGVRQFWFDRRGYRFAGRVRALTLALSEKTKELNGSSKSHG